MNNNACTAASVLLLLFLLGLVGCSSISDSVIDIPKQDELVLNEHSIAIDAYIYAYPMLEYYKSMYFQNLDPDSRQFIAFINEPAYITEVADPQTKSQVRYNNDNLYTLTRYDLRSEPMVWSVPDMGDRYFVIQFVDMFSHNFDYIGTRSTGNESGDYMLVGPDWHGDIPGGIKKVIKSETNFPYTVQRTSVLPDEVEKVAKLIKTFKLLPLHQFVGTSAPEPVPIIEFPAYDQKKAESIDFIEYFNFLLEQVNLPATENKLFDKYSNIAIGAGNTYNPASFNQAQKIVINAGIAEAINVIKAKTRELLTTKNGWQVFSNREKMQGDYLTRAAAARFGLYGNDDQEVYYPATTVDADGLTLNASQTDYILHFTKEMLPPVNGFWSLSAYNMLEHTLVTNPINRYTINSRAGGIQYAEDGSLTLYIQNSSPGKAKQANWLPAPKGNFILQFRAYLLTPEALKLESLWMPPMVKAVK
jgi:hypothetical protein